MPDTNNDKKPKKSVAVKKAATKKPEATASKPAEVKKKIIVKKKTAVETVAKKTDSVKVKRTKLKVAQDAMYATGRRKESTAKVWLFKGTGQVKINSLGLSEYMNSDRLVKKIQLPLTLLNLNDSYDLRIDVIGGGLTGQAEAACLGVSRAVLTISEDFRSVLRENGLLTQDRREKERKKYGKRGARKSPQFRKR